MGKRCLQNAKAGGMGSLGTWSLIMIYLGWHLLGYPPPIWSQWSVLAEHSPLTVAITGPCPYRCQGCRKPCIAPRPQDGLQICGLPQACPPLHQGPEHRGPCGPAASAGFAQKTGTAPFILESLRARCPLSCSDVLGLPGRVAFTIFQRYHQGSESFAA